MSEDLRVFDRALREYIDEEKSRIAKERAFLESALEGQGEAEVPSVRRVRLAALDKLVADIYGESP